ncbi:MAG TPA: DMT family transporter, partial [Aggregatilineaceae bacterium]|nr:DMT family transporter [Aggregatilineaceae bacterium]
LTIGGVAWVVTDRKDGSALPDPTPRNYVVGVLFGLGGALGQAGGMIASKRGLEGDFSALSGNVIRLMAATISIWLFTITSGQARRGFAALQAHPGALRFIAGGAFVGPFLGVWLSLIAVQHAPVGIATTLTSLMPIFLLPLGRIIFKERITGRALAGTILAIAGITVLFLHP